MEHRALSGPGDYLSTMEGEQEGSREAPDNGLVSGSLMGGESRGCGIRGLGRWGNRRREKRAAWF